MWTFNNSEVIWLQPLQTTKGPLHFQLYLQKQLHGAVQKPDMNLKNGKELHLKVLKNLLWDPGKSS